MKHLLVRHQVADFAVWKPGYDAHRPARQAGGLRDLKLTRNIDDPRDLVLLFEVIDDHKARQFVASPDLAATMQKLGVVGPPTILFIDDIA